MFRVVGFNIESVIVRVNGRVVLEEEKVEDGVYVEVIFVVFGG